MRMDLDQFQESLRQPHPPDGLNSCLLALWWAGKGEWDQAHNIAQDVASRDGAWVHAYLHRVEGDLANAAYWYRQAGKPAQTALGQTYEHEWAAIVTTLLDA
jgi:hypothetical protein